MISDEVSRIYFKKSDYDSLEDLFSDMGRQINILMKNDNAVIVYTLQDVRGVYVLEFNPVGIDVIEQTKFPTWLDANELTAIQLSRVTNKLNDIEDDSMRKDAQEEKEALEDILFSKYEKTTKKKKPGNGGGPQA